MLVNVIDLRARQYRWTKVVAVVESASKDNAAPDSDPVRNDIGIEIDYAEKDGISVREAFLWADRLDGMVTLYLYDREEADGAEQE